LAQTYQEREAMRIEDIMTRDVVTVGPDATLKEAARALVAGHISGMPVVEDDGRVLGVLSEGDLLYKQRGARRPEGGLLGWFVDRHHEAEDAKLDARLVKEAMTSPALTIEAGWSLASAADCMLSDGVNRLPVVRAGRLVGIVTRADIVRAFARSDADVEQEVTDQLNLYRALWNGASRIDAHVADGAITLSGELRLRSEAEVLPKVIAKVPGVVEVTSELTWTEDDG
jgi:CBS domain-containing protein